ncbi:MAG TPA: dihydrodipicolinate reductase C-terminal domain-containing protein [Gemmatimonadaceae bacterium]|nr:dihydrodipicolinate reductase C-terminal domain-containing protein [Gemmatimonadaceae bacterium]
MTVPRIAVIGLGKMGRAVAQLAEEREWPVVATFGADDARDGEGITRESLGDAEVAIEFTTPAAAPRNIRACVRAGCPVVVGTTGWYDERERVERDVLAANGALLWSPNFSLGVNLFWQVAEMAARLASRVPGFDAHIVETHHAAKRDAPSGTALELARLGSAALGREIPVTSVRIGHVPGTHELLLDAPFEQIQIRHVARDRRVFAEGALTAARWLVGRHGVFTMRDLLLSEAPPA